MFCPKCGHIAAENSQFCTCCGASFIATDAPKPALSTATKPVRGHCNRCGSKNKAAKRPGLGLIILLSFFAYIFMMMLALMVVVPVFEETKNFGVMPILLVPWGALLICVVALFNKAVATPCSTCNLTHYDAMMYHRYSAPSLIDKLFNKIASAIDKSGKLRNGWEQIKRKVITALGGRNIFSWLLIACFALTVLALFGDATITFEGDLLDEVRGLGELLGKSTDNSVTGAFIALFAFKPLLLILLILGSVFMFLSVGSTLITLSRGIGRSCIYGWFGFFGHLIAVFGLTEQIVIDGCMEQAKGSTEIIKELIETTTVAMNGTKVGLILLDILFLIIMHLAHQFDKTKWKMMNEGHIDPNIDAENENNIPNLNA